jgi:hypothetical protein
MESIAKELNRVINWDLIQRVKCRDESRTRARENKHFERKFVENIYKT